MLVPLLPKSEPEQRAVTSEEGARGRETASVGAPSPQGARGQGARHQGGDVFLLLSEVLSTPSPGC